MAFGQTKRKKSAVVKEDESLGYTHTYSLPTEEKGSAWARPKYQPEFKELHSEHLGERKWLR